MFKKRKSISIFQKTESQVQKVSTSSLVRGRTVLLKKNLFIFLDAVETILVSAYLWHELHFHLSRNFPFT